MNTYTLFWRDGKREVVHGTTAADAMNRAGYGAGALPALDFHARGDNHDWEWDADKRDWVSACVKVNTKRGE
jgi:hypothetical protein